jgi:hypothetical protein
LNYDVYKYINFQERKFMEMVRKQVYIEARQEEVLKFLARDLGISEAELIRRGLNGIIEGQVELPRDRSAWQEQKRFIEARMKKQTRKSGKKRTWRREDLYAR